MTQNKPQKLELATIKPGVNIEEVRQNLAAEYDGQKNLLLERAQYASSSLEKRFPKPVNFEVPGGKEYDRVTDKIVAGEKMSREEIRLVCIGSTQTLNTMLVFRK